MFVLLNYKVVVHNNKENPHQTDQINDNFVLSLYVHRSLQKDFFIMKL